MLKSEKQKSIAEIEEISKVSKGMVIAHYHGLTVKDITALRRELRSSSAGFKVVKNTLARIATKNVGYDVDRSNLSGPTAIAYSEDPLAAIKIISKFASKNSKLKVIAGVLNGDILNAEQVEQIAKLPSLDELRGKLVGLLQAPASKIIGVLQAPGRQVACVIQAYADKNK